MNKLKRMLALVLCAAALSSALVMPAAAAQTRPYTLYYIVIPNSSPSYRTTIVLESGQ